MRWDQIVTAAAAAAGLLGAGAAVYAKATMADTERAVAVLQAQRIEDLKTVAEMKAQIADIHRWMLEGRSTGAPSRETS